MKQGSIILFPGCKNNCVFCNSYKEYSSDENMLEQELRIKKLVSEFKKSDVSDIDISGSDPIEYKSIIPFIKYLKSQGFNKIRLSTHGRNLEDKEFCKKIISAGASDFGIPLFGSSASLHDSVTKSKASFDETIEGVKNIKSIGARVEMQILLLQQNKNDLIEMLNLCQQLNVDSVVFCQTYLTKEESDKNNYPYYVTAAELEKPLKTLLEYLEKNKIKNAAIIDVPFCVVARKNEFMENKSKNSLDLEQIPLYRKKEHLSFCKNCSAIKICDGFFSKEIRDFGIKERKPLD